MKERLTKREKNGLSYFPTCFTPPCNGEGCKDENCIFISDACERLAEYEDLNDQIRAMFGDAVTLKDVVDSLEQKVREPGNPDPVNARILTYEESDVWDAYKAIGTPEQCREAVERTKWIPVTERMPKERDSIFAKLKGTDNWKNGMFEKTSGPVIVTVCSNDGSHRTTTAHTNDGKWKVNTLLGGEEVVAWMPLPKPYHITSPGKKEGSNGKK